ncbi:Por secretion system C-terminal sorting domain-containing protein [Catalinimonas alkaloidigena]|uniref:Por secretion system C-terminal sorting domain-containing protein n=1 Tax=Catalinimonas alkaloidigena TaxID=1075417 RepID=A0A1G8X801_9BACT|nr:T9SS type A sorting domain-containing protein [Catalinimonas alkaloidigena]SDJ85975.1 Por secretion system C-terminal sorting domain-containing protein [Catalinimonas alkaloidigena]
MQRIRIAVFVLSGWGFLGLQGCAPEVPATPLLGKALPYSHVQTAGPTQTTAADFNVVAYPNPFRYSITINTNTAGPGQLQVSDAQGAFSQRVELQGGQEEVRFDFTDFPSGTYWCEVKSGNQVTRMALLCTQ